MFGHGLPNGAGGGLAVVRYGSMPCWHRTVRPAARMMAGCVITTPTTTTGYVVLLQQGLFKFGGINLAGIADDDKILPDSPNRNIIGNFSGKSTSRSLFPQQRQTMTATGQVAVYWVESQQRPSRRPGVLVAGEKEDAAQ